MGGSPGQSPERGSPVLPGPPFSEVPVKLLIFVLLLLAAAYFAPAPVAHQESQIDINQARDDVWTLVSDLKGANRWDPAARDVKITSSQEEGEGAVRFLEGPLVKTTERVTDWVLYNKLSLEVTHTPGVTKFESSTITLTPNGAYTKVTWSIDYQMAGGYLGALTDKLLLGSLHSGRIDSGLANLKRLAETGETQLL